MRPLLSSIPVSRLSPGARAEARSFVCDGRVRLFCRGHVARRQQRRVSTCGSTERAKWGVNLMSKSDDKTTPGAKQSGERIDNGRREALVRFGKYTAPAMLAMLASVDGGMAHTPISPV
jgi:hypothetical protein